jgi:hypothetical protein
MDVGQTTVAKYMAKRRRLPFVVAMSNVSNRFLTAIGMPSSAPFAPLLRAASAARACSIALLATISYAWKPNCPLS